MTEKTDIEALRDRAECMANLLDNLAGYEPQDIDMDTVEIRFEDGRGLDTGCDISIVDTAQKSADIIRSLLDQLEAERQQREAAEKERERIDRRNAELNSTLERWSVERAESENEIEELRAALRGEQEPVEISDAMALAFHSATTDSAIGNDDVEEIKAGLKAVQDIFTRQPKPVVVLSDCDIGAVSHMAHWYSEEQCEAWVAGVDHAKRQMQASGIVVKDGEKTTKQARTNVIGSYENSSGGLSYIVTLAEHKGVGMCLVCEGKHPPGLPCPSLKVISGIENDDGE